MSVPILPTISTSCIVISANLVAIGWRLIWKRQIDKHKKSCYGQQFCINFLLLFMLVEQFYRNTALVVQIQ